VSEGALKEAGGTGGRALRPEPGVSVVGCGAVGRGDPPVTGAGYSPDRPEEVGGVGFGTVVGDGIGGFCSGVTRVVPGRADLGGVEGRGGMGWVGSAV
ncbi:hypothetical protein, partial [Streptomyces acidiscabies]|uniref:hypothetical protein n=1 Tax=Streptomyces acidiscabies TaxID=42234 RepID=UPI0038F675AE